MWGPAGYTGACSAGKKHSGSKLRSTVLFGIGWQSVPVAKGLTVFRTGHLITQRFCSFKGVLGKSLQKQNFNYVFLLKII